ncbi:FkbM family methyltransferase (plasmid) [Pedobacter sp. BS3]|uniref:FkbM family methyltransferase n=1 Tax=Pedobacter sp. BS3 TaxID=2567937 RepID=UPI0011EC845F|nr:FkbM family methyltransferase [Pedobacter sp. BS3]TZF86213.1 FkbM family methyltransferase [Pedobacter sp. BS3]
MSIKKKYIKHLIWKLTSGGKDYNTYKVLSGPAKGVKLNLDIRKEGSYWLGNYDNWILKKMHLHELIKPGFIVWDCGAYVGYYTAIFRKLVGEKGQVITFEASKSTYSRLKEIPILNNWGNVTIKHCAVGPDNSEIQFVSNLNGSNGPYGLSKQYKEDIHELELETVKCYGIDELVSQGLPKPDLIKFDIESAEVYALMNGHKLFTEKKPILFLELHGKEAFETTALFLEKYKYCAKDIAHFNNPSKAVCSSAQELLAIGYIPHMLICWPQIKA